MASRSSSSTSICLKTLPSLPPSSLDSSDATEETDVKSPLVEKRRSPISKLSWSADIADIFVLLCSFLLTSTCIVLVALVFHTQATASDVDPVPREILSNLQRVISALSVAITSAVIMVAGRRYVLLKLATEGIRSRKVAVYNNPSITNIATYLLLRGVDFPLLCLSAVWGLALVTSLTVNNCWDMESSSLWWTFGIPFGPFTPATPGYSWVVPASEQLNFVVSSLCSNVANTAGLINVTSSSLAKDCPTGIIYYPALPHSMPNVGFSFSTTMNGFNISMEPLSSVPSAAQNLTCTPSISGTPLGLWSYASDNQMLSIIATSPSNPNSLYRFNATAIIMAGTLTSTGDYTEFALNGTSWPNVMPVNDQWAQDITSLICNTTLFATGDCFGSSLSDIASLLNTGGTSIDGDDPYSHWSTILSMALGAYSSVMYPHIGGSEVVSVTQYGLVFTAQYGIYILILYIVASLVMLVVVVRLRRANHLGADFINPTRLLLDPLKKPELFNASLNTTVTALGDPYMVVKEGKLLLTERRSTKERREWVSASTL